MKTKKFTGVYTINNEKVHVGDKIQLIGQIECIVQESKTMFDINIYGDYHGLICNYNENKKLNNQPTWIDRGTTILSIIK